METENEGKYLVPEANNTKLLEAVAAKDSETKEGVEIPKSKEELAKEEFMKNLESSSKSDRKKEKLMRSFDKKINSFGKPKADITKKNKKTGQKKRQMTNKSKRINRKK